MAPFAQKRVLAHLKPETEPRIPNGPGGRPSEYKPEYCDLVRQMMMDEGISLTAFAGHVGVARETVYAWTSAHREFSDAVSRARSARTLWLERKLLRSKKGAETTAAIFALKNAQPDEWRDLKHIESTHLHAIAQLTDAQLMAIAQGLQPASTDVIDVTPQRLGSDQG